MKRKIAIIMVLLITAAFLIIAGCTKGAEEAKKAPEAKTPETAELTGIIIVEGKWVGSDEGESVGWELTFSGNHISITSPSPDVWYKGTFKLNTNADPKTIDMVIEESSPPKYTKKTSLAIYKIEGNTLTLASNEPGVSERPTSFKPTAETVVLILTKQ